MYSYTMKLPSFQTRSLVVLYVGSREFQRLAVLEGNLPKPNKCFLVEILFSVGRETAEGIYNAGKALFEGDPEGAYYALQDAGIAIGNTIANAAQQVNSFPFFAAQEIVCSSQHIIKDIWVVYSRMLHVDLERGC